MVIRDSPFGGVILKQIFCIVAYFHILGNNIIVEPEFFRFSFEYIAELRLQLFLGVYRRLIFRT